ncbi:MAG: ABC transporter ATP-binding protein, partial [Anaerolineales bacterium]
MSIGLTVQNLQKRYASQIVLQDITFTVKPGEILALLGASGCGKSTTLAIVAGLEEADSGDVLWDGISLKNTAPHLRHFGLMFQDLALFPHLNVYENIAFGLRYQNLTPQQIKERIAQVIQLVNLSGMEKRDVNALSGGEQQRVALARALAPQPRLLMLDEPLASLDRTLKERLIVELREILRQTHQTVIYVTHDQEEAFMIADQIVLMNQGKIEQMDTPHQIYTQPKTPFVAKFLGMNNLFEGEIQVFQDQPWLLFPFGKIPYPTNLRGKVIALIRPQAAHLGEAIGLPITGTILKRLFRGDQCQLEVGVESFHLSFLFSHNQALPREGET